MCCVPMRSTGSERDWSNASRGRRSSQWLNAPGSWTSRSTMASRSGAFMHTANNERDRLDGPGTPSLLFVVNVAWFFISHRLPLAIAARNAGYEVHVLTHVNTDREAGAIESAGLILHHVPLNRGGLNPLADLGYFLRT